MQPQIEKCGVCSCDLEPSQLDLCADCDPAGMVEQDQPEILIPAFGGTGNAQQRDQQAAAADEEYSAFYGDPEALREVF
jgi:hypothetical protein